MKRPKFLPPSVQSRPIPRRPPRWEVDPAKIQTLDDVKRIIGVLRITLTPEAPGLESIKDLCTYRED